MYQEQMSLLQSEDSPQSDGNMDVSEASSVDAGEGYLNNDPKRVEANLLNYKNHYTLGMKANANTTSLEMYNDNEVMKNKIALNNQILKPLKVLTIESEDSQTQQQRRSNIARTLAKNHPLMISPTITDSDSDDNVFHNHQFKNLSGMNGATDEFQKNYPDVVPTSERLHIKISQALKGEEEAENILNVNCDRKTNPEFTRQQTAYNVKSNLLKCANFRASSPDLLSSGSEVNVSQYQATVDTNYQTVALMSKREFNDCTQNKHLKNAKKAEDISSLDSISNHSFDGDEEHNLASLSPSSSLMDGIDDEDGDCEEPELLPDDDEDYEEQLCAIDGNLTPTPKIPLNSPSRQASENQQLPQYSAAEERRDSRNWQKITLPDGRTRDIDMRVIEPYKRVLSHGGYLKSGGHNAIVIFCACHLPDRSRTDYNYVMDNLFLYVVKTLEQLVTDDYVLIYLHGGSNRRNMPSFPWLKKCYQLLDRRLRKSLKNMYLVHPTFWIKSIIWMTRPFVSTKFWRKLVYVKSLDELSQYVSALEKAAIPEKVKQYDSKKQ